MREGDGVRQPVKWIGMCRAPVVIEGGLREGVHSGGLSVAEGAR